jgi:hypothetical protein
MNDLPLNAQIFLSIQKGLLSGVSPALRGVAVDWHDNVVRIVCYFDGPISEEDQESMSLMETEVMADLPWDFEVSAETVRKDAPSPMDPLRAWAYKRRE